ncbi:MAG: FHA domain-containing protein [Polyangia bacterium]
MFTILVIGKSQCFLRYFEVTKIEVGRALSNDLVLHDLCVSRRHCTIAALRSGFWVEDHASTNGCYVRGQRMADQAPVLPADEIGVGTYSLYLQHGRATLESYLGRVVPGSVLHGPAVSSQQRTPSCHASATGPLPTPDWGPPVTVPTRASLRRLITRILRDDSEFDAFCLDHFPHIRARFANNMNRISKVTQLIEWAPPAEIILRLYEACPEEFDSSQ